MDLTAFRVMTIRTSHSEHMLGSPVPVIDEDSFYRIAGTYILDKFKIKTVERKDNDVIIHMKDGDVVLTVTED